MNEFDKSKAIELSDEEMEKVVGGWSQNEDGTYNIYDVDSFIISGRVISVLETKLNATLDTKILCEWFIRDENDMIGDSGIGKYPLRFLLFKEF